MTREQQGRASPAPHPPCPPSGPFCLFLFPKKSFFPPPPAAAPAALSGFRGFSRRTFIPGDGPGGARGGGGRNLNFPEVVRGGAGGGPNRSRRRPLPPPPPGTRPAPAAAPAAAAAPGDGPPGAPRELSGEGAPGTTLPCPRPPSPVTGAHLGGIEGDPTRPGRRRPLSPGARRVCVRGGKTPTGTRAPRPPPAAPRLTWDCSGSSRRRSGPR